MAASEDGTKVVVFGGMLDNKVVGSDTWILDVATLTWSSGPDYKTKRCMNACTIVGDTFIGWGGYDGAKTANGTAILFDIPTKSFVQQYSPPSSIAAKSTNKGAIIGACIGVIVLAIMVAGFVYWFRKRKRMNQDKDKASSIYAAAAAAESDMHDSGHGANPSPLPEPKEMPAPTPMFSPPSKADKYFEQARKEQQWPLQPISVRGSQTVLPLQRPSGEVYRQPYQQRESQLQIQLHPSVQGSSHQSRTNQDEERVLLEAMIRNQQQLIQIQQQMLDVSYSGGRSPPCPTSPTGYFFPTTAATSQVSQVVQRPSPTIQQQHTRPTLFIPPNPVQHNPHTLEDGQSAASSQTRRVNNIQMDYP
ncbi:hypothetical protein B0O80DRAFT_237276 [Mortierella sp. GBAus27b]|nr:hypothetical protein B0O80DRAFT_237276 [Mortierella sp. GBAus27b]